MLEGIDEAGGHGLVVATGIADVGEDLGEGLFVVDLAEVAVLRQVLLVVVIGVDVGTAVVAVGLAMYEALQGQAVGEGRLFGWPANGERGDGHYETGQLEGVDNLLGLIDGGAEVAVAQSLFVHQVAERLRIE